VLLACASLGCASAGQGETPTPMGDASLADSNGDVSAADAADAADAGPPDAPPQSVPGWIVFGAAKSAFPLSASVVDNPGFEVGAPGVATGWSPFGAGFQIEETSGHSG